MQDKYSRKYTSRCYGRSLGELVLFTGLDMRRHARRRLEELLDNGCLAELVEWAISNDAAPLLYELGLEASTRLGGELAEKLRGAVEEALENARQMAGLIRVVDQALEARGVDYAVFKTFNRVGRIDVDVDLVVKPRDYVRAIRALRAAGLVLVDDVSKTYATGLMLPGNPIVLDLHTQLTVLGVPYLDASILFIGRERRGVELVGGVEVEAWTAAPLPDTVARIGHAVVKEAEVRLDDATETLRVVLEKERIVAGILEKQGLSRALRAFLRALTAILATGYAPARLSRVESVAALLERIVGRGEPVYFARAARNLGYARNAAHLAKMLLPI